MSGRFPTYAAEERLRALGADVVPLHGTAAPPLPAHVVDAVARTLAAPGATPPARGLEPLREALASALAASTGRPVDPGAELLVTNGAMQALGVACRALLGPGDEVVVPAPCFFFDGPIRAAGAVPVLVPSTAAAGWAWDADALAAAVGPRTRALVLCNPGNPTGRVPPAAEVAAAVAVAVEQGLLVLTDEAYEASIWEGALSSAFGLAEDVVVVRSLGKSLSMPQLRIGLLAGPAARVERCAQVLEWDCLRVNAAAQTAALAALAGPRDWLDAVHARMAAGREVALGAVAHAGLPVVPPAAAPFLFVGDGADPTLGDGLAAAGLPVVDGGLFGAPGHARLPFGGADLHAEALADALARWTGPRVAT